MLLYVVWLLFPITIITADIGRHLMDGNILLTHPDQWGALLHTNFYSTSHPDFLIINHHWAAGLVFALVQGVTGWYGLHIFAIVLCSSALIFMMLVARKNASWVAVVLATTLVVPMLGYRHEIRPELIAYALMGLMLWVIAYKQEAKALSLLPFLQLVWVNVHASFPVGIAIMLLCTLDKLNKKSDQKNMWVVLLIASGIATLLNPSGISGALYPLRILQDPGYAVLENQTIPFLTSIGVTNTAFTLLKVCAVLLVISIGVLWRKKKLANLWMQCVLAGLAVLMGFLAVRHITLAGFLLIPVFAATIARLDRKILISLIIVGVCWNGYLLKGRWIVLGLEQNANAAAEFIKEQEISGPIFNNFDIGGYLIYHLYPNIKPYVYNRPESHPSEFWTDVYIPMMQDTAVWERQLEKHRFNAIVLYYGDRTTWAQQFLQTRLNDPHWEVIFVDSNILIFVRNTAENWRLIRDFRIPKEKFIVR